MTEPTNCATCDWLHATCIREKWRPEWWVCAAHPDLRHRANINPMTGEWKGLAPFMRCANINGGACPMYREREVEDGNG